MTVSVSDKSGQHSHQGSFFGSSRTVPKTVPLPELLETMLEKCPLTQQGDLNPRAVFEEVNKDGCIPSRAGMAHGYKEGKVGWLLFTFEPDGDTMDRILQRYGSGNLIKSNSGLVRVYAEESPVHPVRELTNMSDFRNSESLLWDSWNPAALAKALPAAMPEAWNQAAFPVKVRSPLPSDALDSDAFKESIPVVYDWKLRISSDPERSTVVIGIGGYNPRRDKEAVEQLRKTVGEINGTTYSDPLLDIVRKDAHSYGQGMVDNQLLYAVRKSLHFVR